MQQQLVWFSLPFAVVCLLYLKVATEIFSQQPYLLAFATIVFLAAQAISYAFIKRNKGSAMPALGLITLDISIVFGIMIYTSVFQSSIYLLFFAIFLVAFITSGLATLILASLFVLSGHILLAALFGLPDLPLFISHFIELSAAPIFALLGWQATSANQSSCNLEHLLNQSPLPIFTYNLSSDKTQILFANAQAVNSCALTCSTDVDIEQIIINEDVDLMRKFCQAGLASGQTPRPFLVRGRNSQGNPAQLLCLASPFHWQGENIGICYIVDITEQTSQIQKIASSSCEGYVSTLVATIVHDLRNILTTIIGTAEVLQFTLSDQDTLNQVARIIDSGDRGSEKITQLLQLDKINQHSVLSQDHDIRDGIKNIIDTLRLRLAKGIKLELHLQAHTFKVEMDMAKISLILANLIDNAARAIADRGTITVNISTEHNQTSSALKITVTDNGCGVFEDQIPLMTQAFWSSRKEQGATGLGLTIVKRIATKQGGSLEISSTPDVGTQVSVLLPETKSTAAIPDVSFTDIQQLIDTIPKKPVATKHKTKPCTILLVDDNSDVLTSQRLLVEAMGHHTFTATSGAEGLKIYTENAAAIQMVITDFKMPNMDGIELAKLLRDIKPDLPIVMLTGYGESSKLKQCKDLNITLLLKPCGFQKLSHEIQEIQNKNPNLFS